MSSDKKNFYKAKNLSEALYYLKSNSNIKIYAGGTSKVWREKKYLNLPSTLLFINNIPELKVIDRHERYIEFGSCVTLMEIELLGKNRLPATLFDALQTISNPYVKNIATIGGCICMEKYFSTLCASLIALNAKIELRNSDNVISTSIEKFTDMPNGYILTKIKIPYANWDTSVFRRLGPNKKITKDSATFAFLADTDNGIINNVSIVFAGPMLIYSQSLANALIGSRLPLSKKMIESLIADSENFFDVTCESYAISYSPILKQQYLNLLENSLKMLR